MLIFVYFQRMYRIRLHFKDNKDSKVHIGCLEFEFEFDLNFAALPGIGKRLSEDTENISPQNNP